MATQTLPPGRDGINSSAPLCQISSRPLRKPLELTRRSPPFPPTMTTFQHRSPGPPASPTPNSPCIPPRVIPPSEPCGCPGTPRKVPERRARDTPHPCSWNRANEEWPYAESLLSCGIQYKHIDYPVLRDTQVHKDGNNSQYNLQATAVSASKSAGRTLAG